MAGARHELVSAEPHEVDNYPRCLHRVGSDAYTLHALSSNRDGTNTGREHRVGEVHDDTSRICERLNPRRSLVLGRDLNLDAASAFSRYADGLESGALTAPFPGVCAAASVMIAGAAQSAKATRTLNSFMVALLFLPELVCLGA